MATADEYAAWIVKNADKKGTPDFEVVAKAYQDAKAGGGAAPATAPASVSLGDNLRQIPRQIGLTARYGLEGLGSVADIVTEPIRHLVVNPAARALGLQEAADSTSGQASKLADAAGLPKPLSADERVVGDASRLVAGSTAMGAGALSAAGRVVSPIAKATLTNFAARPAIQGVGAATSGMAGGSVREAGGSDLEQFGASLLGGVAGGLAADKLAGAATSGANAIRRAFTPRATELVNADQQIALTLDRSGIDWAGVPERIKQGMRQDAAQALANGQPLSADALRRLLVFRRAGVTPTVGQLTQDPGQITREANLAKVGANSTDPTLQRLPSLQNQNTRTLLSNLDEAGAGRAPDAMGAGSATIGTLQSNLASANASNRALYAAARDSQGRSVVLDGPAAAQAAMRRLQADNVGKLPPEVDQILNDLTSGRTPLTVDYQQQLVKNLFRKMQGAGDNGDLRHGLRIVREALDNADIPASRSVNPGNLPAVSGTVPQSTQQAGEEAVNAFRAARSAHRELRARIEGNPALQAVEDGVQPDQFVQRFVIGKGASAADVQALRNELDPATAQGMRDHLVRYLRDKATGGDSDITKFGGKTYRDALRDIRAKLPAFFTADEIQHLEDIGNAAKYMQAQPAGAAVNNSNSGALVIGQGLDILARIGGKAPIVGDTIRGTIQGVQQRQVMTPANALQQLAPPKQGARVNPLLAAVAASPANAREDDRRK
jgi:hypothetical protein